MPRPVDTPESVEALAAQMLPGKFTSLSDRCEAAAALRRYAAVLPVVEAARDFMNCDATNDREHLAALMGLHAALANLPTEEAR